MNEPSTISVTTGPERGKVFEITQELIHIGAAPENEIVIEDDGLKDHQASIVRRDDRFAIFAPEGAEVEIDGSVIPVERWVWLPDSAMIKLGGRTTCQFQSPDGNGSAPVSTSATSSVAEIADVVAEAPEMLDSDESANSESVEAAGSATTGKRSRSKRKRRSGKRKREVARFLTDTSGDALVQLGEDGTMPELMLEADADKKKTKEKGTKENNPLIMYVAMGLSFLMSLSLLVVDLEPSSSSRQGVSTARQELEDGYYGDESKELEPYQRLLREAQFARSRGDQSSEQQAYRRILGMLNSEDKDRYTGLTGSEEKDVRLKELISTLMDD